MSVLAVSHPFSLWPSVPESLYSRIISVGGVTIFSPLNSWQNLGAVTFCPGEDSEVNLLLALFRFGPSASCILNKCYNLWVIAYDSMELGQVSLFSDLWARKTCTTREQERYFCHGKQPRSGALQNMAQDLVKK